MKKGYIKITNHIIKQALQFPADWTIEDIKPSIGEQGNIRWGEYMMLISGDAFPETNNLGDAEIVSLIVHKETVRFEVEREKIGEPLEPHMEAFEKAIKEQICKNIKARYPETEEQADQHSDAWTKTIDGITEILKPVADAMSKINWEGLNNLIEDENRKRKEPDGPETR